MFRRSAAVSSPGALRPMKTSAPWSTSWTVPILRSGLVLSANHSLAKFRPAPPRVHGTLPVDADDLADAGVDQDPADRHAGCADARDHDRQVTDVATGEPERVPQRGQGDHGRAVLVVVEDRDVERRLERLLHFEGARRLDVLEVDAAERGAPGG